METVLKKVSVQFHIYSANNHTNCYNIILAGCFYPFKAPNHIVQRAINLLPQTIILNLSTQLEQQQVQPAQYPYILTLAAIIIYLFIMANQKTKKQVLS